MISFMNNTRFMIDIRNTGMFTVGFILGCLIIGWDWQFYWIKN